MTNRAAIVVFILILVLFGIATLFLDNPLIFVGRKLIELIQWVAFWR